MSFPDIFIYIASLLLFIFLSIQSGYLFFFALAGRLASLKNYTHTSQTGRFIIYLFCNHEDDIPNAAKTAASLCYPNEKKHVVIITNPLHSATALTLQDMPVQVIELSLAFHSKTKALQLALQQTKGSFDYALLLNAKDVCTKGFLYRINDALQSGFGVVQGQHIVQNTTSAFALLDAISEGVDTHIFCKSHQLLGLSSAITGSGVGIRYSLFQDMIPALSDVGNLEKEMELHLLRRNIHFGFAPKAYLYEERKSRCHNAYQKYHSWTTVKSRSLKACLSNGVSELRKGNVDFLDKVFQNLLLPRIFLLGITPLIVLISFLNIPILPADYWIALWAITYAAIFMSMPAKYITHRFLRAVFFLPILFVTMTKMFINPKKKQPKNVFAHSIAV